MAPSHEPGDEVAAAFNGRRGGTEPCLVKHDLPHQQYCTATYSQDGQLKPRAGGERTRTGARLVDLTPLVSLVPVTGTVAWLVYKRMQLRLVRHVYDKDGVDAAVKIAEATRTDPAEIAKAVRGVKDEKAAVEVSNPPLAIEAPKPDAPPDEEPGKAA